MALDANGSVTHRSVPPVSYITAVWLGMSPSEIAQGITDGIIDAPPGWSDGAETGASSAGEARATTHSPAETLDHQPIASDSESDPLPPAVDRDDVRALFRTIDSGFSDASFDQLWTRVGQDDASRTTNLLTYLSRRLLGSDRVSNPDSGSDAAIAASLQALLSEPGQGGRLVDLIGKSGEELAELAKTDAGYRYALLNLDPIAVIGNEALLIRNNGSGELDRFDRNTGEQNFSDAWLADRSKLLAWKLATEAGASNTIDGAEDRWSFIDHRTRNADGTPYHLELGSQDSGGSGNTVVFGDDAAAGELLKGGAGTDRIYGGGGDDVLRGNAGDDHLEGGAGDDLVMGGVGSDDVAGDQGSDELEGGTGDDRLRGGTGDDVLTGGRGDDRLEGGAGHDIYVIDPSDGSDTIVDADSDGEIQFDGRALTGATNRHGKQWLSDDGRVRFSFSGDPMAGGTLSIGFYRSDNAADAAPDNLTKLSGWHNGDLGIVLGDGSAAALATQDMPAAQSTSTSGQAGNGAAIRDPGTSGDDGQGVTWIDPVDLSASTGADGSGASAEDATTDDVANLFSALDPAASIGPSLVTADHVHAAVMSWAGVREAPDVPATANEAAAINPGVTPSDLTGALLDLHDAGHDVSDAASVTPTPAVPSVIDLLHTREASSATTHLGGGVGNLQRRAG